VIPAHCGEEQPLREQVILLVDPRIEQISRWTEVNAQEE